MATYKRELRKEIKRRAVEPEINFLNITAMMDMMTIILVFLLKTMSASSASIPQSGDLTMPKSVLTTEASQEGLAVLISKSSIVVDDAVVCPVPADSTHGIEGKYKRSGPNDLYIVPLGAALLEARRTDRLIREARGEDVTTSDAILVADASTPYRLIVEVLYTLGQSDFGREHLLVMSKRRR
jgi:biopolymer transport protein ExbD